MKRLITTGILLLFTVRTFSQSNYLQARVRYEQGDLAMEAGYFADALKIFEECIQKYDSFPMAKFGGANAAYYNGNYTLAKKYVMEYLGAVNNENIKPQYEKAIRLAALIDEQEKSAIEMVYVKGGAYFAGCKDGRDTLCESEEIPGHPVIVGDFYIAKYEVTQALWTKIMGNNPSGFPGCNDCPVENVSWENIQIFLGKLNRIYPGMKYRLPTEAEWEFSARGGNKSKGYKYSGSNNSDAVSWSMTNSEMKTHPVGSKTPNELGLYDMGGNVWEWCSDCFETYTENELTNPKGYLKCSHRTDRGGCWQYSVKYTTPGTRGGLNPYEVSNDLGFRLAGTP